MKTKRLILAVVLMLLTIQSGVNAACVNNSECGSGFYCAKAQGDCTGSGECGKPPDVCVTLVDEVCGCDGQTYSNDCFAASAGVSVAYKGVCRECLSVEPDFASCGDILDIIIKGTNTNFSTDSIVSFPTCAGITVNSISPVSATELVAYISISENITTSVCDVAVTTGTETITCESALEIIGDCNDVSISPPVIDSGTTTDITITGTGLTGFTKDDLSFEGCGIIVNSCTATSDTEVECNLTTPTLPCENDCVATPVVKGQPSEFKITVEAPPCCALKVRTLPIIEIAPRWLPGLRRITIIGEGECNWDRTCVVSIEGVNVVIPLIKQPNKITALILIPSKLFGRFEPVEEHAICIVCGTGETCGTIIIN